MMGSLGARAHVQVKNALGTFGQKGQKSNDVLWPAREKFAQLHTLRGNAHGTIVILATVRLSVKHTGGCSRQAEKSEGKKHQTLLLSCSLIHALTLTHPLANISDVPMLMRLAPMNTIRAMSSGV